jgi:hypothetical protein
MAMSIWTPTEMRRTPLHLPNGMVSNLGGLIGLLVSYRMPLLRRLSKSMLDAHIIINDARGGVVKGGGVVVEEDIVSLEPNDDLAMGAPPGALVRSMREAR